MKTSSRWIAVAGLLSAVSIAACSSAAGGARPGSVRPGPPEQASRPPAAEARADTPRIDRADVRFMHGMIAHHAQALEMAALVPARSGRDDIRLLAERIRVSQESEIALMRRWLQNRGHPLPDAHHAHGGGEHARMPGMLSPEEMTRLAAATGAEFDRLFLEYMIRHHEGALTMVAELFASPGATQDTELFRLASDVDADQRAEIARMRRLLSGPAPGARPR